jgi:hypothetical protein
MDAKKLIMDKTPKFRFVILSSKYGSRGHFELEDSFYDQKLAERYFTQRPAYLEMNFYLVDFETSKLLAKRETYQSRFTELITGPNPESPDLADSLNNKEPS